MNISRPSLTHEEGVMILNRHVELGVPSPHPAQDLLDRAVPGLALLGSLGGSSRGVHGMSGCNKEIR